MRYGMLNRKPLTQYIALRLCRHSSSMNKQDAQRITQNKQCADDTQLVHTSRIHLIRIYNYIICVASPDISRSPHSTNMRLYAKASAPRTTQLIRRQLRRPWPPYSYASLAQMSLCPRTLYVASSDLSGPRTIYVASSDFSGPRTHMRRQPKSLWAPALITQFLLYIYIYIYIYNSL